MSEEELIETETDLEEEAEESGSDYKYISDTDRKVFIEKDQFSIFETHRRFKRGDIILRPIYQRKIVWTDKKKSRLIESVLQNIPIPVIYLAEQEGGKKEVVDGQQRLDSFFSFLNDDFSLTGLLILDHLNNKKFIDIAKEFPELQRKLEDYQLSFFIIKNESHPDIRFDIFQRVNEGATKLNAQEMRNSIYRGKRIELLKRMADDEFFKKMIEKRLAVKRLKDQEAVLRFLAFYINGYESYNGNLNSFLNNTLEKISTDEEYVEELKILFRNTMKTVFEVFGKDAFAKANSSRKKVNLSIFDILSCSFAKYHNAHLLEKKDALNQEFSSLYNNDIDFYQSITSNTLTKSNVNIRFKKWFTVIEKYFNDEE